MEISPVMLILFLENKHKECIWNIILCKHLKHHSLQCHCVHISVTKRCIVGYLPDALWDLWDESMVAWRHQITLAVKCNKIYAKLLTHKMKSLGIIHIILTPMDLFPASHFSSINLIFAPMYYDIFIPACNSHLIRSLIIGVYRLLFLKGPTTACTIYNTV